MSVFGIHVGNSNACIAVYRDGRGEVVANDAGERTTPATVAFLNGGREIVVGTAAKQGRFRNASVTVTRNKTLLENENLLLENLNNRASCAKVIHESKTYKHNLIVDQDTHLKVTANEVHQHILRYIRDIAESQCEDEDLMNVVLTVPASMNKERRQAVAYNAKRAGLNVLQVVSEAAAACLAYNLGQSDVTSNYEIALVFRAGGVGTEASLIRVGAGMYSLLSWAKEDESAGGNALTEAVSKYLAEEFLRKYKVDPRETKRGVFKLLNAAENVKHILSTLDTANCYIESLNDGIDFSLNVTRARFDNEVSKVIPLLIRPIQQALDNAKLEAKCVSKVILVGGTCKIPKVINSVSKLFPNAEMLNSISPDEVFARGAAAQAALLTRPWTDPNNHVELKALSGNIVFKKDEGVQEVLIQRLTPIPVRRSYHFSGLDGNVAHVKVFFIDQEKNQSFIAEFSLTDLEEDSKISLSAHVYRDGNLHLALTDKKTNKCEQLTTEIQTI